MLLFKFNSDGNDNVFPGKEDRILNVSNVSLFYVLLSFVLLSYVLLSYVLLSYVLLSYVLLSYVLLSYVFLLLCGIIPEVLFNVLFLILIKCIYLTCYY